MVKIGVDYLQRLLECLNAHRSFFESREYNIERFSIENLYKDDIDLLEQEYLTALRRHLENHGCFPFSQVVLSLTTFKSEYRKSSFDEFLGFLRQLPEYPGVIKLEVKAGFNVEQYEALIKLFGEDGLRVNFIVLGGQKDDESINKRMELAKP